MSPVPISDEVGDLDVGRLFQLKSADLARTPPTPELLFRGCK
jgi:hypothetical protein